jgi:hypothetical protein
MICRKPHVASSICLRATIFQNPEGTLWTQCISYLVFTSLFLIGWGPVNVSNLDPNVRTPRMSRKKLNGEILEMASYDFN